MARLKPGAVALLLWSCACSRSGPVLQDRGVLAEPAWQLELGPPAATIRWIAPEGPAERSLGIAAPATAASEPVRESFAAGDADVLVGDTTVAGTRAHEADPSGALDARGRLWLAWNVDAESWGHGGGLHGERRLAFAVRDEHGAWRSLRQPFPARALEPDPRFPQAEVASAELPRFVAATNGVVWLFYRAMLRFPAASGRGSFRQVGWQLRTLALTGSGWEGPWILPESLGPAHDTLVAIALADGRIAAAYESDGREQGFGPGAAWDDPLARTARIRAVELALEADPPEPGEARAVGRVDPPTLAVAPDPDPALTPAGFVRLWGDLHRHSDLSRCKTDLDGSVPDQYRYAREVARLDFVALTDHFQHLSRPAWAFARRAAAAYDEPPRFFSLMGFERSLGDGHRNLIALDAETATDAPFRKVDPKEPYAGLDSALWIAIPHQLADNMAPLEWKRQDPEFERLAEIYQSRRNSYEADDAPRSTLSPRKDARWMRDLLADDFRFGVIASSDHEGTGSAFTAVYAKERTRAALFEGLRARRTYAATARMALEVQLGERGMGEAGAVAPEAELLVRAAAGDEIARVSVWRNGQLAHSWEGASDAPRRLTLRTQHAPGRRSLRLRLENAECIERRDLALEADDEVELVEGRLRLTSRADDALDEDGVILFVRAQKGATALVETGELSPFVKLDEPGEAASFQRGGDGLRWRLRVDPPVLGGDRFEQRYAPGDWKKGDWVYVRLERSDGELAWSSPIWVD